jgi:hypothetical protein
MLNKSKDYETSVANYLISNNPDFLVKYNCFIKGRYSQIKRQIDILLVNDKRLIIVECKYYNKKVNIKVIEEFISFLEDVGVNEGLLITNIGVTKSVIKRISESEIKSINEYYSGKKEHALLKDIGFFYRNSYLNIKKRYDITLIKHFPIGYAVIHGILKPNDLNWTITAMKKMLNTAIMIEKS